MSDPMGVDYGIRRVAVVHPHSSVARMIRLPVGDDIINRQLLAEWLYGHVSVTKPGIVAVESPIVGASRNLNTGMALAMMAGALAAAAGAAGARVVLVAPAAWKKQVVGKGNASKDDVSEWLDREHPVLSGQCHGDQDLADAACIGLYASSLLEGVSTLFRDDGRSVLRGRRRAATKHAPDRDGEGGVSAVPGADRLPDLRPGAQGAARSVGRDGAA